MPDINWIDAGGWAFSLLLIVTTWILVMRGGLVSRSTAETWRDAWKVEREAGQVRDEQITELLDTAKTTNKLIRALQEASEDQ